MNNKRILFFTRYTRKGASSRLRTFQFQKKWEDEGFDVVITPFFNEKYLNELYTKKTISKWNVLKCYWNRFRKLFDIPKSNVLWIEKELFPFLPPCFEWLLHKLKIKYIVDFDDAVFLNYTNHASFIIRHFFRNKIACVIQNANKVIVGNNYLGKQAIGFGAKNIFVLPTVIDSKKYFIKKQHHFSSDSIKIGWIGSPITLKYFNSILTVLETLNKLFNIEIILINGGEEISYSGKFQHLKWHEENEARALLEMDIGLMPLFDTNWEKGKCAYKIIQYMASGLPVVASSIGMNKEIVIPFKNGFLAKNQEDWLYFLTYLIENPLERSRMGSEGYELIHSKYTLEANFKKMLEIINGC